MCRMREGMNETQRAREGVHVAFSLKWWWLEWDAFLLPSLSIRPIRPLFHGRFIHFSCLAQSLMIVLKTIACSIQYVHCRPHFCSLHTIIQYYICSLWTFAEYFSILSLSLSARRSTLAAGPARSLVFMSLLLPNWVNEQGLVGVCISHLYVQRTGLQSKLV